MNCPCNEIKMGRQVDCGTCWLCPGRSQTHKLIALYVEERKILLTQCSHEYIASVLREHIRKVEDFITEEELNNDIREHLRMTLDEWYETL